MLAFCVVLDNCYLQIANRNMITCSQIQMNTEAFSVNFKHV